MNKLGELVKKSNSTFCTGEKNSSVLYIGGFDLPDKNAAAQRVVGIAKGLRELGYSVVFLQSSDNNTALETIKDYYGFKTIVLKYSGKYDYLISAKTALKYINKIKPGTVIAYNYPGISLNRIRRVCVRNRIRCIADATEWYRTDSGSLIYRVIKGIDTAFRMRIVHKRMNGVIAISRFLNDYYSKYTNTVLIPPTVDIDEEKWLRKEGRNDHLKLIYAGSPSKQKERLDQIIVAVEQSNVESIQIVVIGITEQLFRQMYGYKGIISQKVLFLGRVEHRIAIEELKKSDWSVILRDSNWVVNAGFPTKLVESISCGTPVIINRFSNVEDYLDNECILIDTVDDFNAQLIEKMNKRRERITIRSVFDYHNFIQEIKQLMEN